MSEPHPIGAGRPAADGWRNRHLRCHERAAECTHLHRIAVVHLAIEGSDRCRAVERHAASAKMRRAYQTPDVIDDDAGGANERRPSRESDRMEYGNAVR